MNLRPFPYFLHLQKVVWQTYCINNAIYSVESKIDLAKIYLDRNNKF